MARLIQLAILATLALLTFAAPAPGSPRSLAKRSFKAKAPGRRQLSGLEDIARTERKYRKSWEVVVIGAGEALSTSTVVASTTLTITPLPYSTSAPSAVPSGPPTYGNSTSTSSAPAPSSTPGSEDGSVAANPDGSSESYYLSPVTVGGQKLNLDFDTGSADLWVFGPDVVSAQRTSFKPNQSSTWERMQGATWSITYGDRSGAEGYVGTDVVDVGGSTVQKQAVEVAEQVSDSFASDDDLDGLLGLSFSSLNNVLPQAQNTFFDNVKSDLTSPLFTADLEESTGKGTYDFGTIDHSKYVGDIHYTPIDNSSGWWQINTPSILIGEQSHDCSDCSAAIVDTGTTLLYLDTAVVKEYYDQVSGAVFDDYYIGGWTYPCSQKKNLPSFGIGIGDWYAHINGTDMHYASVMDQPGETVCMGGLQQTPQAGLAILGDVFLKQFFVVFDGGNMQVGVANKDL